MLCPSRACEDRQGKARGAGAEFGHATHGGDRETYIEVQQRRERVGWEAHLVRVAMVLELGLGVQHGEIAQHGDIPGQHIQAEGR